MQNLYISNLTAVKSESGNNNKTNKVVTHIIIKVCEKSYYQHQHIHIDHNHIR